MNPFGRALSLAALAAISGCATPTGDAAPTPETRVLVKLAQPSTDAAAIERAVEQSARVPARYVASSSAQWHALALRCGTPSECDAALERLRAERAVFEAAQRDERRRIVTP